MKTVWHDSLEPK